MFYIQKRMEIATAHQLNLPYESKCLNLHGHNSIVTVHCMATDEQVEENNGMVIDFVEVKKRIHDILDHSCLSDVTCPHCEEIAIYGAMPKKNPTAENIAKWICYRVPHCYKVEVQESDGNIAVYQDDSFHFGEK